MDQDQLRELDSDLAGNDAAATYGGAGKSTLTSRLTPAPQMVFRVSDPETARALGESLSMRGQPRIMRDTDAGAAGARDANGVASGAELAVDRASSSTGSSLPSHIQRQFEDSLGADLSSVRVHTGADSAAAAHAVGAKAYTVGQDIHFAAGKYQPEDPFGMHLLAHEVAHTVQQSGGSAHRQNKLEVSAPQDAAEHEADRAADAMVRGASAQVTGASGVARKTLHRDVVAGPEESLLKTLQNDEMPGKVDEEMSWGMHNTTKEDGTLKGSHDNVTGMGQIPEEMQKLSQEISIVKPLQIAYIRAVSAVNTIRSSTGIDHQTPEAYASSVDKLGEAMHQSTQLGKDLSARVKDISSDKVSAAADRIASALKRVNAAKSKLSAYQSQLKAEETKAEKDKETEKLEAIRKEIKMVADVIKAVATHGLALSKAQAAAVAAVGAVTQRNRDLKMGLKDKSKPNKKWEGANDLAEKGGTAYEGGAALLDGDPLEKLLEWTIYEKEVTAATTKIAALGAEVEKHNLSAKLENKAGLSADLEASKTDVEAAKKDAAHTNREFFMAMNQLGRDWDQRNMTDKEKADPNNSGAVPDEKDAFSMEGILSMYAALQARGHARKAFADQAIDNDILRKGTITVNKGLMSPMMFDRGDGQVGEEALDSRAYQQAMPDKKVFQEAQAVRATMANVQSARYHVLGEQEKEAACEAKWVSMISTASAGKVK